MGSGEAFVKIYDADGNLVSSEEKGEKYFDYTKPAYEVALGEGYVIEVKHFNYVNKVKMISAISGGEVSELKPSEETTRYVISNGKLKKEGMSDEEVEEVFYGLVRAKLIGMIEDYQASASEAELNDRAENFKKKAYVIAAYRNLREADRAEYTEFVNRIIGSSDSGDEPDEPVEPDEPGESDTPAEDDARSPDTGTWSQANDFSKETKITGLLVFATILSIVIFRIWKSYRSRQS